MADRCSTIASADGAGVVLYIGTLSKVLAPGLRVGYIVATPAVLRSVVAIRFLLDIQGDLPTEAAIATLMEDGELQRHISRVRRVYANRREILANSLRHVFGEGLEITPAGGGRALWVRVRLSVDVDVWRAAAWRTVSRGTPAGDTPSTDSPNRLRDSALPG